MGATDIVVQIGRQRGCLIPETPWNRLRRATGIAPLKGVARSAAGVGAVRPFR